MVRDLFDVKKIKLKTYICKNFVLVTLIQGFWVLGLRRTSLQKCK